MLLLLLLPALEGEGRSLQGALAAHAKEAVPVGGVPGEVGHGEAPVPLHVWVLQKVTEGLPAAAEGGGGERGSAAAEARAQKKEGEGSS